MIEPRPLFYRKPDGGYVRPIFKLEKLKEIAASIPGGDDVGGRSYGFALVILDSCFGRSWLLRHVLDEPKDGFLARSLGSHEGSNIVMHRVRDLAEMVLNLLPTKGVEAPLDQLVAGRIEEGVAELTVGKLLHQRGVAFRFIWPSGVRGHDFDLEIVFPNGAAVCADTKCKLETNAFTRTGFRNSLDDARKRNLPKGHPGAVFVKIPQTWVAHQDTFSEMESVVWDFLRQTKRIVTVQVYAEIVDLIGNVLHDQLWGWEYINTSHDFDPELDWRTFATDRGVIERPSSWTRLTEIVRGDA